MKESSKKKSNSFQQTDAEEKDCENKQDKNSTTVNASNNDCLIILVILLTVFVIFSGILNYSIFESLSVANSRLQKMELKFHKFLFYIKYIYKSEKTQQQMSKQQNNSLTNFLNKISKGFQQKEQPKQTNQKQQLPFNDKVQKTIIFEGKETIKQKQQSVHPNNIELLSEQEMIDIAIKIIEQEDDVIVKKNQHIEHSKSQIKTDSPNQQLVLPPDHSLSNASSIQIETFSCHIDEQNIFYKDFQFDPQTSRLKKSKYTSTFQSILCEQPIPKSGTFQFSVKILRTLKSFIYVGIIGGNKTEVYNFTSLHQSRNFYGYSGYSGRIWQATKRRNCFQIFQTNTVLKLRVNMNQSLLQYFFNQIKVGQSHFEKLCEKQCRFMIEMRDDGDEIQFVETLKIDNLKATKPPINNQF